MGKETKIILGTVAAVVVGAIVGTVIYKTSRKDKESGNCLCDGNCDCNENIEDIVD